MRKLIALTMWALADGIELVRGGLLAGAVALLDEVE